MLSIVNRSGNRPSHEGAAEQLDLAILRCREAGFRRVYLRGDTDFTQSKQLEAWDAEGVRFLFGIDAMTNLKAIAEALPISDWAELDRPPQYTAKGKARARPEKLKDRIVRQPGYQSLTRTAEHVRASAHFSVDGKDFTESGSNPRKALISGVGTRRLLGKAASTVLPERSPTRCKTLGFALFVENGLPKSFDAIT